MLRDSDGAHNRRPLMAKNEEERKALEGKVQRWVIRLWTQKPKSKAVDHGPLNAKHGPLTAMHGPLTEER